MFNGTLVLLTLLFQLNAIAALDRNISEYNINQGLGLHGQDPVSYFPEGNSNPNRGIIAQSYKGVTYRFINQENAEIFLDRPEKFEPTYGGWCAWAMSQGSRVDIDYRFFTINGNRIHFFFSARAKSNFDRDISKYEALADQTWKRFSGEEPRF
jgi:YHS domain-containing protein